MRTLRLQLCSIVLLLAACSRETPAPPPQEVPAPPNATIPATPPAETGSVSYDDGVNWLRSAESFRFTIRDGEVQASGDLKRETVGAESVTMRVGNEEWRAAATPSGVTWEKQ